MNKYQELVSELDLDDLKSSIDKELDKLQYNLSYFTGDSSIELKDNYEIVVDGTGARINPKLPIPLYYLVEKIILLVLAEKVLQRQGIIPISEE